MDVVIPVYNRPEYSQACLDSLYKTRHGARIRPIIVDNGSRTRTRALIEQWVAAYDDLPDERMLEVDRPVVVRSETNTGFAGAINRGLEKRDKKSPLCILHNDTIPFPGWLGTLSECLETSDEEVSVVIPRTNYANELSPCIPEIRSRFSALKPNTKDRLTPEEVADVIAKCYPEGSDAFVQNLKPRLDSTYCPEICSFCMLIRPMVIEAYGLFDEDFWPRGWEDKWWFRPIEREGGVCAIAERSFVHHFGNMTSDGPGFCWPDIAAANEKKYKEKCIERDRRGMARS